MSQLLGNHFYLTLNVSHRDKNPINPLQVHDFVRGHLEGEHYVHGDGSVVRPTTICYNPEIKHYNGTLTADEFVEGLSRILLPNEYISRWFKRNGSTNLAQVDTFIYLTDLHQVETLRIIPNLTEKRVSLRIVDLSRATLPQVA